MAVATKAKPKYSLESIARRVDDIYRRHEEDIETNAILRFGAGVFGEMKFLLEEVERLSGNSLDIKDDGELDA